MNLHLLIKRFGGKVNAYMFSMWARQLFSHFEKSGKEGAFGKRVLTRNEHNEVTSLRRKNPFRGVCNPARGLMKRNERVSVDRGKLIYKHVTPQALAEAESLLKKAH